MAKETSFVVVRCELSLEGKKRSQKRPSGVCKYRHFRLHYDGGVPEAKLYGDRKAADVRKRESL